MVEVVLVVVAVKALVWWTGVEAPFGSWSLELTQWRLAKGTGSIRKRDHESGGKGEGGVKVSVKP